MTNYENIGNDDELLDRLVDGELPRQEYEQLLRSFDQQPEGWRRCAMAFLEAQAWQKDLSTIRDNQAACPPTEVSPPPVHDEFNWTPVLAVAASFLIAFALGLSFRLDWFTGGSVTGSNTVVERSPATAPEASMPESALAEMNAVPAAVPNENITLVLDRGDGSSGESVELPVLDWSPENERLLTQPTIEIPPDVQRMLQQSGRQLRTHRRIMPVRTQDGRQVLVPVEQLEITPVGEPLYQ